MIVSIMASIAVIIIMLSYVVYELIVTKKSLQEDIKTAQDGLYELERFTYHDESEIKSWIEDEMSNLQYDVDDHGTSISNLQDETVNQDEIDELKEWITKGEDKIIEKVKLISDRIDDLLPVSEPDDIDTDKAEMAMEILEKHRDVFNNDSVKQLSIILDDDEEYCIINEKFEVDNG